MKTTVSLIVAVAVGVGIGLLIAPEAGSETRRKLADSAGDWMEKLKNFFASGEEEAADKEDASSEGSESYQQTPAQSF